jgi:hypothetical protein
MIVTPICPSQTITVTCEKLPDHFKLDRNGYWLRWWNRADRLANYLRSQGLNPDDIP